MNDPQAITIKRARDFHLIDSKGNKYVDLSLAENGAVLGHKYSKTHKAIKQALDKGLEGNYHTHEKKRVATHIHNYLKEWTLRAIIHTHLSCHAILQHPIVKKLQIDSIEDLLLDDPAHTKNTKSAAILYRLYSGIDRHTLTKFHAQYLFVVMPIEWGQATVAVLEKPMSVDIDVDTDIYKVCMEPSSVLLAGMNYVIPKIIDHAEARPFSVQAKNRVDVYIVDPLICPVPSQYSSARLELPSVWRQQGIYIVLPCYSYEKYQSLWREFLSFGFYLPRATEQHIPRVLAVPTYMTKHEVLNWGQAIQSVA